MTFTIFGDEIKAKVASFRSYSWQGGIDFLTTFSPGVIEAYPTTLLAAVTAAPGREQEVERVLANTIPDIYFIPIGETLKQIAIALSQLSLAASLVGGIAVGNGLLVLIGSLAMGRRRRQADAVITRVLGASRAEVLAVRDPPLPPPRHLRRAPRDPDRHRPRLDPHHRPARRRVHRRPDDARRRRSRRHPVHGHTGGDDDHQGIALKVSIVPERTRRRIGPHCATEVAMPTEGRSPRLAVLIDADNASSRIADGLFEEIAKIGEASVRRIYGDFSNDRFERLGRCPHQACHHSPAAVRLHDRQERIRHHAGDRCDGPPPQRPLRRLLPRLLRQRLHPSRRTHPRARHRRLRLRRAEDS